jgi:thymidylate synthase (FAD)
MDPLAKMQEVLETSTHIFNGRIEVLTPSVEVIGTAADGELMMRHLEAAIRTAYKSEDKIGPGSHEKIIAHILSLKHESTLEHCGLSFRCVTNRGVSHELVRHRLASYTQESTRYVNYGKRPPQVILPWHLCQRDQEEKEFWYNGHEKIIQYYLDALKLGWKPQDARGFLPNDLKTEIVMTMNLRALRHFFKLRTAAAAHPDMQVMARKMFQLAYGILPLIFQDIQNDISDLIGFVA